VTIRAQFTSAKAFRQSLEARLKQFASSSGNDIQRLRRQVAFDRLLARIFGDDEPRWTLKGGYAMELWLNEARTTRDIDLALRALRARASRGEDPSSERLRDEIQDLAHADIGDWFFFEILPATLDIDAAPYGGARFPVVARMDGRIFVRFDVDVGVGDAILEPVEIVPARDWLGFAGIAPPALRVLSKEQQFAEKLHAYTRTDRPAANSRVKDLVDLALLVRDLPLERGRLGDALTLTFSRRGSHALPIDLSPPPPEWARPFADLAAETKLGMTVEEAFEVVRAYYLAPDSAR
jgi:hypothetical protein